MSYDGRLFSIPRLPVVKVASHWLASGMQIEQQQKPLESSLVADTLIVASSTSITLKMFVIIVVGYQGHSE